MRGLWWGSPPARRYAPRCRGMPPGEGSSPCFGEYRAEKARSAWPSSAFSCEVSSAAITNDKSRYANPLILCASHAASAHLNSVGKGANRSLLNWTLGLLFAVLLLSEPGAAG